MGLFDRFKRRVKEVADEVNTEDLTVTEDSTEGQEIIAAQNQAQEDIIQTDDDDWEFSAEEGSDEAIEALTRQGEVPVIRTHVPAYKTQPSFDDEDDDWEDFDDDDDYLPQQLTRKEKKRLQKEQKQLEKAKKAHAKAMKKRGAKEVARPQGSKVDLSMMRTTTGRKLVEVAQAPKGSVKSASIKTESGSIIEVDLGGGVVEQGGRLIKSSSALDNLLEELEWVLLESDISSDAVSTVIDTLRNNLIGSRLRKGTDLSKVVEAALKR